MCKGCARMLQGMCMYGVLGRGRKKGKYCSDDSAGINRRIRWPRMSLELSTVKCFRKSSHPCRGFLRVASEESPFGREERTDRISWKRDREWVRERERVRVRAREGSRKGTKDVAPNKWQLPVLTSTGMPVVYNQSHSGLCRSAFEVPNLCPFSPFALLPSASFPAPATLLERPSSIEKHSLPYAVRLLSKVRTNIECSDVLSIGTLSFSLSLSLTLSFIPLSAPDDIPVSLMHDEIWHARYPRSVCRFSSSSPYCSSVAFSLCNLWNDKELGKTDLFDCNIKKTTFGLCDLSDATF